MDEKTEARPEWPQELLEHWQHEWFNRWEDKSCGQDALSNPLYWSLMAEIDEELKKNGGECYDWKTETEVLSNKKEDAKEVPK
jgi:hypothetical protein